MLLGSSTSICLPKSMASTARVCAHKCVVRIMIPGASSLFETAIVLFLELQSSDVLPPTSELTQPYVPALVASLFGASDRVDFGKFKQWAVSTCTGLS
jgi:hypothetical protein